MSDSTPSSLRSAQLQLGLVVTCMIAALWAAIALHLGRSHEETLRNGERDNANLSLAFAEQVVSTARAVDFSLLHLRSQWVREPRAMGAAVAEYQEYLKRQMTVQVGVIDARGMLVYSSLDARPGRVDLSDREHFRVHAERADDRLFISKPLLGRVSQKWSIQFTRPIRGADGSFQGVVVVSIAPDYFSRFYESIHLGPDGVVSLLRDSGDFLARYPAPEKALGKALLDAPFLVHGAAESGVFRMESRVDAVDRFYNWRRIPDLGLTVVVGQSESEMMAPYRQERASYVLGGALLTLLLLLLAGATAYSLHQRNRATAELAANELRYRSLVSALTEGVLLVDRRGVILAANAAARKMFAEGGLAPEGLNLITADMPVTDGEGHPVPREQTPLALVLRGGSAMADTVIGLPDVPNGPRWLRVSVSPLSGPQRGGESVVVSFTDITAERRVQETQRLASAVIHSAAEGVLVTGVNGLIEMVNPAFTAITGYQADELIGKTPRVLRSGRHDQAFYQAMWQDIVSKGTWRGEIWNRRKSGEIYPEWLVVSVVPDASGKPRHYIGVFSDISERKQREHRIWRQANFDALTDLPNRSHFQERLDLAIAEARRNQTPLALLFVDLDHFKWVNDTLGHEAGNQLLRQASRRMAGCLRGEDTLARLSGDEFVALLPTLRRSDDADVVARKLLETLAQPYRIDERDVVITASIGIALFPSEGEDGAALLRNADAAMYRAKEAGRNGIAYFTPALHARAEERLRLAAQLRRALAAQEFRLYFQPVMAADGCQRSAEALLRWQHPERGVVGPGEFVPVAEEVGIVPGITDWVLPTALAQLRAWHDSHGYQGSVAINLSSVEFRNRRHLDGLLAVLAAARPAAASLILEITETSLLSGDDTVLEFLQAARALGARIALDDFGTGYSSLSYLSRFPFDIVKIDRQFVARMLDHEPDLALVEAILAMARRLHLKVVAEGVETEAQRDCLVGLGCDLLQGYLFSPPLPAAEFAARFLPAALSPDRT